MTIYALTELHQKRAELAGEIIQTEKRAKQLRSDLAHVEAAIRILRPNEPLPKLVPKRVEYRPRYFKRGQLTRLLLDYIRQHAGELITVEAVMPLVVGDRNLSAAERIAVKTTTQQALHRLARRGTIEQITGGGRTLRWQVLA